MSLTSRSGELGCEDIISWKDEATGLRAILVIDDSTLGPAAGGIRTRAYENEEAALIEVAGLARAMTLKCALGGLEAGGAKAVVLADELKDRAGAFERLGMFIEELDGRFRTAGDLGTTDQDLEALAKSTQYVHTNTSELAASVARGLEGCILACGRVLGRAELRGLKVAIQGCGTIGAALAKRLAGEGVELFLADTHEALAHELARDLGAKVVSPDTILSLEVDILSPCAVGGVINEQTHEQIRARALCGGANNIVSSYDVAESLSQRGVLLVPDILSSGGAVIDGIGASVMGLEDRDPLIDALGQTTFDVLNRSLADGTLPTKVAEKLARERIEAAR